MASAQTVSMSGEETAPPTVRRAPKTRAFSPEISEPTVFSPKREYRAADFPHQPIAAKTTRSPVWKILGFGGAAVVVVGLIGAGALAIWLWPKPPTETLPDHLGIFAQSSDKNRLDEIKKFDFSNALDGKESLIRDESLPSLDPNPTLILFSDAKDVPVSDLRLIQLDTIKDDGSLKQIDFQASPVDNKPEMKRLKIPEGVANGKYAFALIDGFLNEGKHKFWPFQVRNAAKSDNGNALHAVTVSMKPTPSPAPTTKVTAPTSSAVPPPAGGTVAYTTTSNLVLRGGPSQAYPKLRNLRRGEKVYMLRFSENAELFDGILSKFVFVQTENGQTGWVFAAFLR